MNALPNLITPAELPRDQHPVRLRPSCQVASALPVTMAEPQRQAAEWDRYACQQLQGFIHRVFFPGWPKPAHQVVLMASDQRTDTATVCAQLARMMAQQLPGKICAVEATQGSEDLQRLLNSAAALTTDDASVTPSLATAVQTKLSLVPAEAFFAEQTNLELNLQSRLSELRREFNYLVVRAPAAEPARAALMGSFTDGVLLVVQANITRRAAAIRTVETIHAANARLLGVVLAGRTFPIPEAIYEWL